MSNGLKIQNNAVSLFEIVRSWDVEGAVPYDHEIASNLSTVSKLAIV